MDHVVKLMAAALRTTGESVFLCVDRRSDDQIEVSIQNNEGDPITHPEDWDLLLTAHADTLPEAIDKLNDLCVFDERCMH